MLKFLTQCWLIFVCEMVYITICIKTIVVLYLYQQLNIFHSIQELKLIYIEIFFIHDN